MRKPIASGALTHVCIISTICYASWGQAAHLSQEYFNQELAFLAIILPAVVQDGLRLEGIHHPSARTPGLLVFYIPGFFLAWLGVCPTACQFFSP